MKKFIDLTEESDDLGIVNMDCIMQVTLHFHGDIQDEVSHAVKITLTNGTTHVVDVPMRAFREALGDDLCITIPEW